MESLFVFLMTVVGVVVIEFCHVLFAMIISFKFFHPTILLSYVGRRQVYLDYAIAKNSLMKLNYSVSLLISNRDTTCKFSEKFIYCFIVITILFLPLL